MRQQQAEMLTPPKRKKCDAPQISIHLVELITSDLLEVSSLAKPNLFEAFRLCLHFSSARATATAASKIARAHATAAATTICNVRRVQVARAHTHTHTNTRARALSILLLLEARFISSKLFFYLRIDVLFNNIAKCEKSQKWQINVA